jgi:hypothetical protein
VPFSSVQVHFGALVWLLVFACAFYPVAYAAENTAPTPNSDGTYQQLRNIGLSGEAVAVNNLTFRRDAASFREGILIEGVLTRPAKARDDRLAEKE